jgi:hypothetical protein
MSWQNLEHFLRDLSMYSHMREKFRTDPDGVMSDAGLTDDEKKMVKSNDITGIKKYLGDNYAAAAKINIVE